MVYKPEEEEKETDLIRVSKNTKNILVSMKVHPNQSFDEVIQNLIMNKKEV